jgi:hypothetical protein
MAAMRLPPMPGPGGLQAPQLPQLQAPPHVHGGKAEELVTACGGDARALARSLAGAPDALRDAVRASAAERYGNAFVADLEAAAEYGVESSKRMATADNAKSKGAAKTLLDKLAELKQHAKGEALAAFPELAAQVHALESKGGKLAHEILGHNAKKQEDVMALVAVCEALTQIVVAVTAVVVAIAIAVATLGAGSAASVILVGCAAALIASAVATLAVTVVMNLDALLHAAAIVLGALGLKGAAGELDQAGTWWDENIANQKWFVVTAEVALIFCGLVGAIAELPAQAAAQAARQAGEAGLRVGEGVAQIGLGVATNVVSTELVNGQKAIDEVQQEGAQVDQAVIQLRDTIRAKEQDLEDRARQLDGKGGYGLAALLRRIRGDVDGVIQPGQTEDTGALGTIERAIDTIIKAADAALNAAAPAVPAIVAGLCEGGAGAMAVAFELCMSIANGDCSGAATSAQQGAQAALDAANQGISDAASQVANVVDDTVQQGADTLTQDGSDAADTVKSWF